MNPRKIPKIRAILDRLQAQDPERLLRPETVVEEAAKQPGSLLHRCFEWNDSVAAHAHRVDQARALIRRVNVTMVQRSEQEPTIPVSCFVRDPVIDSRTTGYTTTDDLKNDAERAGDALEAEFARVLAALRRTTIIAEQLGLSDRIQDLERRVAAVCQQVQVAVAQSRPTRRNRTTRNSRGTPGRRRRK